MKIIHQIREMNQYCTELRRAGKRVGFVPTMGALHEGHLQLVDEAKKRSDAVVVSIFVNPTQFGPNEDYEKYPRNLKSDAEKLTQRGAQAIFNPSAKDMYPKDCLTTVHVNTITETLCGAHRPGHFDGVALVVTKLFNIVGECVAVFGRKDFQQLQVICRFTADLNMPVQIIGMPTVRESDGLALSSRNAYLSKEERTRALTLSRALSDAHTLFSSRTALSAIEEHVKNQLMQSFDTIDYVSFVHPETLVTLLPQHLNDATYPEKVLVAVAARIGTTRLIDNTVLGEDTPPFTQR